MELFTEEELERMASEYSTRKNSTREIKDEESVIEVIDDEEIDDEFDDDVEYDEDFDEEYVEEEKNGKKKKSLLKIFKRKNKVKVVDEEYNEELAEAQRKRLKAVNATLIAILAILGVTLTTVALADAAQYLENKFKNRKKDKDKEINYEDTSYNADASIEQDINQVVADQNVTIFPEGYDENVALSMIGGSFVDNHNQQLYISKQADLANHDLGNTIVTEETTKKTKSKSNSSSTTNTTTQTETPPTQPPVVVVIDNTYQPSQDYPDQGGYTPGLDEGQPGDGEKKPEPKPVYKGYVLRKLNYEKNGLWYNFYINERTGEIIVNSFDISMAGDGSLNPNNSNIMGLSDQKDVAGWVYVCDNDEEHQYLDSVTNLENAINGLIAEQEAARKSAEEGPKLGL